MTTKKDLMKWLAQFPDDTIIEVNDMDITLPEIKEIGLNNSLYGSSPNVEVTDFRFNPFVTPEAKWFKKIIINFDTQI